MGRQDHGWGGQRDRWGRKPAGAGQGASVSAPCTRTRTSPSRLFAEGSQLCGQAAPGPAAATPCT